MYMSSRTMIWYFTMVGEFVGGAIGSWIGDWIGGWPCKFVLNKMGVMWGGRIGAFLGEVPWMTMRCGEMNIIRMRCIELLPV